MTEETRNYTITGEPEQLNVLEHFFKEIQYLGVIGASRRIELYINGDGAINLNIERDNTNVKDLKDNNDLGNGYIIVLKILEEELEI